MGPTEHDHDQRDQIERTVADTGCDPLPPGRIPRQSRRGIDRAPDQAKRDQNEQEVAYIGVDRTVEETIRPRRDVVHPPAICQHADDGEANNPVKGASDAAPARSRIPYHSLSRSFEFVLTTLKRWFSSCPIWQLPLRTYAKPELFPMPIDRKSN